MEHQLRKLQFILIAIAIVLILAVVARLCIPKNEFKTENCFSGTISAQEPDKSSSTLHAIIECGAERFSYYVIAVDDRKNWKLTAKNDDVSGIFDGDQNAVEDIKGKLQRFIQDSLKNKEGVLGKNIHFTVSSGARKEAITPTVISALRSLGYYVGVQDEKKEAEFGHDILVPDEYENGSFSVDIGKGNTKIAWKENSELRSFSIMGSGKELPILDSIKLQRECLKIPEGLRGRCFVTGGAPFLMAVHSGICKPYQLLNLTQAVNNDKATKGKKILNQIAEATGCKEFIFVWDTSYSIGYLLSVIK